MKIVHINVYTRWKVANFKLGGGVSRDLTHPRHPTRVNFVTSPPNRSGWLVWCVCVRRCALHSVGAQTREEKTKTKTKQSSEETFFFFDWGTFRDSFLKVLVTIWFLFFFFFMNCNFFPLCLSVDGFVVLAWRRYGSVPLPATMQQDAAWTTVPPRTQTDWAQRKGQSIVSTNENHFNTLFWRLNGPFSNVRSPLPRFKDSTIHPSWSAYLRIMRLLG